MEHAPSLTRLALVAALLLPAAATAQSETGGMMDTLFGTDRTDRPIPEAAWENQFQGLYAVEGACDDADAIWAFALDTIEMGRTICTSLGKLTWDEEWLVVPGGQCSRMGESIDSQTVSLREESEGIVTARMEETDETITLEYCPHPGE
jgi:hypothetical protein